jgi:hypothetical protein
MKSDADPGVSEPMEAVMKPSGPSPGVTRARAGQGQRRQHHDDPHPCLSCCRRLVLGTHRAPLPHGTVFVPGETPHVGRMD